MCSEGYGSCHVCLSVCLSVKSHLTSGASVRPENSATYSAANEGQKICGVFSETALFRATALCALYGYHAVGHFLTAEYTHVLLKCHVGRGAEFGTTFMPLTFTMR